MTRWLALVALPLLLVAAIACGGDDDDAATPSAPADGTATPDGSGQAGDRLSDTEYLELLCTGLEEFTAIVDTATTEDEFADVIRDFIASLEGVTPPEDLGGYHGEFLAYLEAAVDDPTSPLTTQPPLPPEDARDRLSALEPSVDACRNPTYFNQ